MTARCLGQYESAAFCISPTRRLDVYAGFPFVMRMTVRLLAMSKCRGRVLLICATNAAVDGVLLRLLRQFGCCDFVRIGRLSEMHPALLPHAVSSSADNRSAEQDFRNILSQILAKSGTRSPLTPMARDLLRDISNGVFPPPMQVGIRLCQTQKFGE